MKRLSFLLFAFIFIGLYLFIYDPNSSFKEQEIKQTQFFSVIKPIWKIQIQNTKDSYELNSLKALQEENKEVFLLDEPIFKTYRDNKSKSSASSVSAVFDLGNELLIMTNNVH
ncbi:MAG: LPS export ABC transporter periplasmic protein LptC, partial [SAR86 cluster bacterium]